MIRLHIPLPPPARVVVDDSGVCGSGSRPVSGTGSRGFESHRPDQMSHDDDDARAPRAFS